MSPLRHYFRVSLKSGLTFDVAIELHPQAEPPREEVALRLLATYIAEEWQWPRPAQSIERVELAYEITKPRSAFVYREGAVWTSKF